MKGRFAVIPWVWLLCAVAIAAAQGTTWGVPSDPQSITHALNRLGFGPRPGDLERVAGIGLGIWIDEQLAPARHADQALSQRLARLTTLWLDSATIATEYSQPARAERRRRQQAAGAAETGTSDRASPQPREMPPGAMMADALRRERQIFTELAEAKLIRATYAERQLEEVLVDFWFNHFNVFARKGRTEIYIGEYEREAIRPHVLGRFRDLLGATAKSPAMLVYLDNWLSADPHAADRRDAIRGARPNTRRPDRQRPLSLEAPRAAAPNRERRGLNENYARELLELHTLGVDGGYSQADVVAVARAFTGWTIGRPGEQGFRFAPARHDRGAKTVLGHTIRSGGGLDDGERVLDIVARHPSTARHIAFKLAQRFVSDAPPAGLVDRAAATFQRTDGDLRQVVRVIVTSPEFFDPAHRRAKVKTPFEFVVSAMRATDADLQNGMPIVRALVGLGMPLYLCQPPTGYDETAAAWVSSGALVNRLNFAVALTGGEMRGVRLPRPESSAQARERIFRDVLGNDVSPATRDTVAKASSSAQTLALAIGSPEFQRQ